MAARYTLEAFFKNTVHCIVVCAQYQAYQNYIIGYQIASDTEMIMCCIEK